MERRIDWRYFTNIPEVLWFCHIKPPHSISEDDIYHLAVPFHQGVSSEERVQWHHMVMYPRDHLIDRIVIHDQERVMLALVYGHWYDWSVPQWSLHCDEYYAPYLEVSLVIGMLSDFTHLPWEEVKQFWIKHQEDWWGIKDPWAWILNTVHYYNKIDRLPDHIAEDYHPVNDHF